MKTLNHKIEFGDFQTPENLVELIVEFLVQKNISPDIIIEPTCGIGNILLAVNKALHPKKTIGIEINKNYVEYLSEKINSNDYIEIVNADIFQFLNELPARVNVNKIILLVGNPPWVTNSKISNINGENLPIKKNIKKLRGIEAITGKSNFDIAEFILMRLIELFYKHKSYFVFLCKTIVARNLLKFCWDKSIYYNEAAIYPIDAAKYFNAFVDSCLFFIDFSSQKNNQTCDIYDSLEKQNLLKKHGYYCKKLIVDIDNFKSHNFFGKSDYVWRNGVKHDCAKVMELIIKPEGLINGYQEIVKIEEDLLYPLFKSSDLFKPDVKLRKKVIITQKNVGDDTSYIQKYYPKTWRYLENHQEDFILRKSSVYKNKPKYSIFSIGDYSFMPFKIAISGLYKKINFKLLSPYENKSVLLDDTCNFISCETQEEAEFIYNLLLSEETLAYLNSLIFWDSKRPITTEILNSINLQKIAASLNLKDDYDFFVAKNSSTLKTYIYQKTLFN